ncbi:unnamed protein product, partial [Didymodactylos carnosus]
DEEKDDEDKDEEKDEGKDDEDKDEGKDEGKDDEDKDEGKDGEHRLKNVGRGLLTVAPNIGAQMANDPINHT